MLEITRLVCRSAMSPSSLQSGDRKIAIAVDLSDESAHAVRWAVAHYLRPGDQVGQCSLHPMNIIPFCRLRPFCVNDITCQFFSVS